MTSYRTKDGQYFSREGSSWDREMGFTIYHNWRWWKKRPSGDSRVPYKTDRVFYIKMFGTRDIVMNTRFGVWRNK